MQERALPVGIASNRTKAITPTMKAAPITPAPTALTVTRPARGAQKRLKITPKAGNSSISPSGKLSAISSPPHQVEFIGVDRAAVTEDGQDYSQADRRFGRCHGHDEEDNCLPVHGTPGPAQRHKRQVDRVEHQLDRHKDDDNVAAQHNPGHADTKQDRAERHEVAGRDHYG